LRALYTDLYQLTMAAGYFAAAKTAETATFELFVRRLPANRDFLVVCGLDQALTYLQDLRFTPEEIRYLRQLPQLARANSAFWDYLADFRFRGDIHAVPEGTVMFAGEPLLTVRAPLVEAQIPETYLLSTIGFQTLIASKAARIVGAAAGRDVVEFGCRRAHAPEAGALGGRAAYLGGCIGTSNVQAGREFGIPVFGTAAHSWVLSFAGEREAFQNLQKLLGPHTVQLIDTFETVEGARKAVALGEPLRGVRLDSGDLLALSKQVRGILDTAGLGHVKIMATNDLDEDTIAALLSGGAPIDVFGVGTSLATSFDAPALSAVYKLVEIEANGERRFVSKHSEGKRTAPGQKQVYRFERHDLVTLFSEPAPAGGEKLLRPMMLRGETVDHVKNTRAIRDYAAGQIARCGRAGHRVEMSAQLQQLCERST
jgi:nicotinate phosphoribosyltransferase